MSLLALPFQSIFVFIQTFPKASFCYSGDKHTNNYPHQVVIFRKNILN